jgi:hypothetical protein
MRLISRVQCTPKNKRFNLREKLAKKDTNVKDDPYETPIFTYNKEMDQLMEVNIISSKVEEDNYEIYPYGRMTESNDEEKTTMLETPCPKDVMTNEEEEGT